MAQYNDDIIALLNIFRTSDGRKVFEDIDVLEAMFFVFKTNYNDLMSFSLSSTTSDRIRLMQSKSDYGEIRFITREMARLSINYLASAKTRVDLNRNLINRRYRGTLFFDEYKSEVESRFSNNPLSNFIEGLRNYSLHYSLPLSSLHIGVGVSKDEIIQGDLGAGIFVLHKSELLKWSNWDKGREFLKESEGDIILEEVVGLYYQQVSDFHQWMISRILELYADEIDSVKNVIDRVNLLKSLKKDWWKDLME